MKIYCCQTDMVWEDKKANHRRVEELLAAAAPTAGSLVVLPEMFATGFSMNSALVAESAEGGPTMSFLGDLASRHRIRLMAGVVLASKSGRPCNSSVLVEADGSLVGAYAKLQPFNMGGEGASYDAGRSVEVFDLDGWKVAPFVCYDLRFPEIFRAAVRRGANLYVVMANWPVQRIEHWVRLLQARAIENQAYVVGVNRVGQAPGLDYNGHSLVVEPGGDIVVDAGEREGIISAELELDRVTSLREGLPFLRDMREDYERLS